jgi:hypothetical protein
VPDVHWASVLVPYLAGAASTFAVQYLIRVLVDPRVDSRTRRDERWEVAVLDLGELVTGQLGRAASAARDHQMLLRAMRDFPVTTMGPDPSRERRDRQTWEQAQKARQATSDFTDLVRFRADWMADNVIDSRTSSKVMVPFIQASYLHRLQVLKLVFNETEQLSATELEQAWKVEGERRLELISQVKKLAALPHAPRKSRSWQVHRLRKRAMSLLASAAGRLVHHRAGELEAPAADAESASD